jgi:hypothetical protein
MSACDKGWCCLLGLRRRGKARAMDGFEGATVLTAFVKLASHTIIHFPVCCSTGL